MVLDGAVSVLPISDIFHIHEEEEKNGEGETNFSGEERMMINLKSISAI